MIYQVTINAAGCLPDSDQFPYFTGDGIDDGIGCLLQEMETHLPEDLPQEDYSAKCAAAVETLRREGAVYVPLEGTYALTVEGQTCQYFALCDNPATQTVHGPTGGGEFGDIASCERCASRMAAL
jgi:hypothetical protein